MKIIYSPTVHLLIVHGAEIIRNSPVAPGFLSEEGSEHNNKIVRYNREHHARQISIKDNLKDCFVRSSNASDPVILHMIEEQILRKRSSERPISAEAYELLNQKMNLMMYLVKLIPKFLVKVKMKLINLLKNKKYCILWYSTKCPNTVRVKYYP